MRTTKLALSAIGLCASIAQANELLDNFSVDFNAHLNMAAGDSSLKDTAALATHAHDPNDHFTLQGIELSASARYGQHLQGFISGLGFYNENNEFDGEIEEVFAKFVELPGGFEARGGRMLARVGSQNNQHMHSWDFVDANLITTRFLGDEGLISEGGELSWWLPFEHKSLFSVGYSNALAHGHGHSEEEEGHDEHDEEEGHDDEHEEHIEGENALLQDEIINFRLKGIYQFNDFRSLTYGASYLTGKNGFKERGHVIGTDFTYLWRENGFEPKGNHVRAIIEPIYRTFDFKSDDGDVKGSASEWGIHSSVGYGFLDDWELGARYDYTQGVDEPIEGLGRRHRTSLALTRGFDLSEIFKGHARLQYNYDRLEESQSENSIWLQVQLDLGKGGEIR
ncbi:hypothetical protein [Rubritalea marina]|uniref:hypothetical protein n=1 Tax=Rubritalea marina TaxID=361055 RepID=UPI00037D0102|nr:hypothetical protein [Rubritalea marina]